MNKSENFLIIIITINEAQNNFKNKGSADNFETVIHWKKNMEN